MKTRSTSTLAIFISALLTLAAGCETSAAFKAGVKKTGVVLAHRAATYAGADQTLGKDEQELRVGQAQALEQACSVAPVRFTTVSDAWAPVKPWLAAYSANDPTLTADPTKMKLRNELIRNMDDLIAAEKKRRSIFFPFTP